MADAVYVCVHLAHAVNPLGGDEGHLPECMRDSVLGPDNSAGLVLDVLGSCVVRERKRKGRGRRREGEGVCVGSVKRGVDERGGEIEGEREMK